MAAIEKLLTMGLAKGIDPRKMLLATSVGTAARSDTIEWTDVMQATTRLAPSGRAVLYLKAAPMLMSEADFTALKSYALNTLIDYDRRARTYPIYDDAAFARQIRITGTAMTEYADPRTCRACKGNRKVLAQIPGEGVKEVSCVRCGGRGWIGWSDRRRALKARVDHVPWPTRYAAGYDKVLRGMTGLYRQSIEEFKKALFDE